MSTKRNAYVNGKIFTSDDSNLYAEAMIVEDGVITWVGKEVESEFCLVLLTLTSILLCWPK